MYAHGNARKKKERSFVPLTIQIAPAEFSRYAHQHNNAYKKDPTSWKTLNDHNFNLVYAILCIFSIKIGTKMCISAQ
jgi:hypothetical protein